jgi:hypothetical protein
MSKYTKKELDEITADKKYWEEFGDAIGWKLNGWTGRRHAGFNTGRQQIELPGFSITGSERDAIMLAINKAKAAR